MRPALAVHRHHCSGSEDARRHCRFVAGESQRRAVPQRRHRGRTDEQDGDVDVGDPVGDVLDYVDRGVVTADVDGWTVVRFEDEAHDDTGLFLCPHRSVLRWDGGDAQGAPVRSLELDPVPRVEAASVVAETTRAGVVVSTTGVRVSSARPEASRLSGC